MDMKEAMEFALNFEKKGHEYYLRAAQECQDEFSKQLFTYLADQEVVHEREIMLWLKEQNIEMGGDNKEDVKTFFSETIKLFADKLAMSESEEQVYKTAMDLEKNAYLFYKKELGETEDEKLKKFFAFLMEQEASHYDLIKNAHDYITDPEGYHMGEENWSFEG